MRRQGIWWGAAAIVTIAVVVPPAVRRPAAQGTEQEARISGPGFDVAVVSHAVDLFTRGRQIFRFDTFGDEQFWGGTLRLHEAIEGERFGGVGPGLSPAAALGRRAEGRRRRACPRPCCRRSGRAAST